MIYTTSKRNADSVLRYLEKTTSDELSYLESVGTKYFTTADLIRLKGQWEIRNQLSTQLQGLLVRIALFSPVWLVAWFLFSKVNLDFLALLSLVFFPFSLIVCFWGLHLVKRNFKGNGHLAFVGDMIDLELHRRNLVKC
ncbi:MAG: hypothetical protein IPJ74_11220 [Saprospiraceae bacterium]|nr:hypothetical protein [Saprospiraceae bacterium]